MCINMDILFEKYTYSELLKSKIKVFFSRSNNTYQYKLTLKHLNSEAHINH